MPENPEPPEPSEPSWLARHKNWLYLAAALAILALLSEAVRNLLREVSYAEIVAAIQATPGDRLLLAALATLVSFAALTGYDWSSLKYVGARLPYRLVAPTAFVAYALANTIGLGVLTGGAVRLRLYGAAGLETGLLTRAIAFNAAAFTFGISVVGAAALLWGAPAVAAAAHLPVLLLQTMAALILASAGWFLWRCARGGELALPGGRSLRLPTLNLVLQQLLYSVLDIVATAAVLWLLLPAGAIAFPVFAGFFAIAIVLGVLSHVPGGLGVFEAVMLVALSGSVPTEQLAGALVLYRAIYYLLPLALALLLLSAYELRGVAAPVARAASSLSPMLLSAFTFITGAMLLVSGATPATEQATDFLTAHVPLPLVEAAHFFGSIAGLALLIVARGMLARLDAAWWAGVVLTLLGLAMALPKGVAVSELAVLGFLLLTLALSRRHFTRKAALLSQAFSGGWLAAVAVILAAVTGLLFFAYQDVEYSEQLWWQFEFDGHAPRSLRALVAVAVLALLLALRQLFRPPPAALHRPTAEELDRANAILQQQGEASAGLALMGDKHLLFSDSGRSFLMFGRRGRSWIALFDPIGPEEERAELVWSLIERARESGGRASFYQVRPSSLPLYLDAGLRLLKLGEEAFVPLAGFTLKGPRRADLRHAVNRAERDQLTFEVVHVEQVPALLPELRAISDAWLANHETAEKSFSLGAFNDAYLCRQPVALVRKAGAPVAFATLMSTARKAEARVDLMRQLPGTHGGIMDFLFAKLLTHFAAEGYARFGLGMAPLSGMTGHPLAPNWHRFGRLLFAHGEYFYNFQGLRAFKEKFDPVWEPRYLAAPGGVAPLLVLTDVAMLISGGLRGVIAK